MFTLQTLPCTVLLLSLCAFILSSRLLPLPQAVNSVPHFPSASNDLIPPLSTPHFLPLVFFIFPFHLSSLLKNNPLSLFSPYQSSITKEIKLSKIKQKREHFLENLFCFFNVFTYPFFFSTEIYIC